MRREDALARLASLKEPVLLDQGCWQFGHTYNIATRDGLVTLDATAYDPVHGPYSSSKRRRRAGKRRGKREDLVTLDDLEAEEFEEIIKKNGGVPDHNYWFFQPSDCPREEWVMCESRDEAEQLTIDQWLDMDPDVEPWSEMDDDKLLAVVAELR